LLLACFLRPSPLFDLPEAWSKRAKRAILNAVPGRRPAAARVLSAQRRIDARIGQLLGPVEMGRSEKSHHDETNPISLIANSEDRAAFRLLTRALEGECELTDEWRKSRRALVSLIRYRLGP
jgi:hypothetical protein